MLEKETSQKVNKLIRGMAQYCIKSYESSQSICSEDIRALAELISAVNHPVEQPDVQTPLVGFVQPDQDADGEDE